MRWPRRIRQAVRHPKPYTPPIHNYSLMLPTDPPQYAASGTTVSPDFARFRAVYGSGL